MCLVCFVTHVPGLHPHAREHGLRAAQLSQAPPRACLHRSAQLGSAFFGMAARPGGHRHRAGHGPPRDLDGAHRLASRGWAVAGRRTPGCRAATAPDLNPADVASHRAPPQMVAVGTARKPGFARCDEA
jgi:hypothetical protein